MTCFITEPARSASSSHPARKLHRSALSSPGLIKRCCCLFDRHLALVKLCLCLLYCLPLIKLCQWLSSWHLTASSSVSLALQPSIALVQLLVSEMKTIFCSIIPSSQSRRLPSSSNCRPTRITEVTCFDSIAGR